MVKFGIAIKTKDRSPKKNFLAETLANLERAGVMKSPHLGFIIVVDSGDGRAALTQCRAASRPLVVDWKPAGRSLHQNAARCIELASVESIPEVRWSMVLEDDLDVSDGFLESVLGWLDDNPGKLMYVLGANYDQIKCRADRGETTWNYPVGGFYGAQALVWRREVAAELAQWLGPDPMYNGVRDHGHDLLLQQWGKSKGETYFLASAPCMVQHIGNESGIGNRFFQFPWGGRDWRYTREAA